MTETMMPFHSHPLSYTALEKRCCQFCREDIGSFYYCNECPYLMHEKCWKKSHFYKYGGQSLPWHDHPLSCGAIDTFCCLCRSSGGSLYNCKECSFKAHKGCIDSRTHGPSLCKHSLKICVSGSLDYQDGKCHFCKQDIKDAFFFYCSLCNITVDGECFESKKRLLTLHNPKTHDHTLILVVRLVTFTCNGCGLEGDRNPYVCLECNIMMHKDCVDLPRVISINHHEHRISRTSHLGYGDWDCGVGRQKINWVYGAFTCSRCPSYAVHSKCATRDDVWDGIELEDEPEEEEVEPPFKVINEKEIVHFFHEEHHLKLHEDYVTDHDHIRCFCCLLPINDDPFYKCMDCEFCLHKECASLPRKKGHFLHNHKLTLQVGSSEDEQMFSCPACNQVSNGVRYQCNETDQRESCAPETSIFDARCASISEPFHHELHPHFLYNIPTKDIPTKEKTCEGCGDDTSRLIRHLSCIVCEYILCMKCATLPRKVKHRCDDHFLKLGYGAGNADGDLWCDICETKTNPNVWYYTCDKCGTTLHVNCVLGDLHYMKKGFVGRDDNIVPNNGVSRPLCSACKRRCSFPFLLRYTGEEILKYFCSLQCTYSSLLRDCDFAIALVTNIIKREKERNRFRQASF